MKSLPFDFVLSYNQENSCPALQVLEALERHGLDGWSDERYYAESLATIESQVSLAWQKARFIVVLVPEGFRDSPWCRAEYEQGLAAESSLALTQVLVLHADGAPVPEILRMHPRFPLDATGKVEALADYIGGRRQCTRSKRDDSFAINRWQSSRVELPALEDAVSALLYEQLKAVDLICSWMWAREEARLETLPEEVTLRSIGIYSEATGTIHRNDMLYAAFSDALETDAVPFQRLFYDCIWVELEKAEAEKDVRDAVDRIAWNQLLVLCGAANRYFREQMLEVAEEIASRATFALFEEEALNHLLAIEPNWSAAIERALEKRFRGNLPPAPPGFIWASSVEHVALTRWQRRRSRNSLLAPSLGRAERVDLASKACLSRLKSFVSQQQVGLPPRHAILLGLDQGREASVPAPNLAIEYFYYSLAEMLPSRAFSEFPPERVQQFRNHEPPFTLDVLQAIARALESVIGSYRSALEVWRERRGQKAVFSSKLVADCMTFIIGPYTVLHLATIEASVIRDELVKLLEYIGCRGNAEAKSLAEELARGLSHPGQLGAVNFTVKMLNLLG